MKKAVRLFVSPYLIIALALTLVGCGGGSSTGGNTPNTGVEDNEMTRPVFQANEVSIAPSAAPTGDITDTTPTFTWNAIENATEYHYGHEDFNSTSNQDSWRSYKLLAADVNCNTIETVCSHTPTDYTFTVGEQRAWWVRGKVNGVWLEWSDPRTFTIIHDLTSTAVPVAITPSGDITDTSPEFSWTSVQDTSEYQFGHEGVDSLWQKYTVTAEQAGCLGVDQRCRFKPLDRIFVVGEKINWWVRSKVNENWGEWSVVSKFTVIEETSNSLIPEQLTPAGDIGTSTPLFSWSMVDGATEYVLGHEEGDTSANWQKFTITPAQAACQNANENCSYTLPDSSFNTGVNMKWWVRAVVNDTLQEWSVGKKFVVTDDPVAPLNIRINEVLAANTRTNLDPDFYQFSDWIELYNPTSRNINISHFGLSDDEEAPLQWKFPEGTIIPANSYLLVWADDEDKRANALHTNFKLSSKGEKVTLSDASGVLIDSIDFEKQESDVSATKQLDAIAFMVPTPGAINGITYASKDLSKVPLFTYESGFFNNAITVALSQENNADIYFTTDGSTPSVDAQKYTQAIVVNETTVIRAIAIENGVLASEIVNKSYFINHTSNLPVVSLTIDADYLYNPKTGIYTDGDGSNGTPLVQCDDDYTQPVNYAQEWERTSHIEYFGVNRESEFSLSSGISISGQCSRQNQKKSFSFELDSKFGTKKLEYKLFESKEVAEFKDFKLRTGALGYQLSDVVAASLVGTSDLNIDYQAFTPTQMFVNGDYWGIYNFRETKGGDFIESNYPDVDKDELDIINQGYAAKRGDTDDYFALEKLLKTTYNLNLSNEIDYQQVIGMVDESNYIDYMALMIYSANIDWIGSNQRSWKEKKPGAKWRWMLDDVDYGFHIDSVNLNQFTTIIASDSSDVMVSLFRALTKNETFKLKFKTRFLALLDTTFSSANMISKINAIVGERYEYIPLENAVWNTINTGRFDRHVQRLKDFSAARNAIVRSQLNSFIPTDILE